MLAHVRIFCRCYSLVLNVGNLEIVVEVVVEVEVVEVEVEVEVVVVVVSRMDLWCYMFLLSAFSNFQRDTAAATPNMLHFLDSLSRIIKYTEKKMTRQTHTF